MPNVVPNPQRLVDAVIDDGKLRLLQPLGRGSGGVVLRAIDTVTSREYAVKCLLKAERGTRQSNFQKRELQYHQKVSGHRNIITLHRIVEEGPYLFLVLDFCPGGDLFKFLTERGTYRRNTALVKQVFVQLIDAVDSCHKNGIYHRDIKPENIMCNEDGSQLRLGDFGLSTDSRWSRNFGAGTSGYMSPECIGIVGGPDSYCARSNDVWALGVILTSMISGHNPWRRAVLTDDCFRSYVNNPGFFRNMLPISAAADSILRRIFTNDENRVSLSKLRRLIVDIDTFFMSDEEIARSSTYVQMAAMSYLCHPPPQSSSSCLSTPHAIGIAVEEVEVTCYREKGTDEWSTGGSLDEVHLSPVVPHAHAPAQLDDHSVFGVHSLRTTLSTSGQSDVANPRNKNGLFHPVPPPQPLPSYSTFLQNSGVSATPPSSTGTRSSSRSRKLCGSDSPVGLLRRLVGRIFL